MMFVAMAALLVALCVPGVRGRRAALRCAYGVVRFSQIGLFLIASRDDPLSASRSSASTGGTAVGVGLIVVAAGLDGWAQTMVWALALALDMAEPFFFGSEGWSLEHPSHFAERHGLIVIIALGESIIAIGIGAGVAVDVGRSRRSDARDPCRRSAVVAVLRRGCTRCRAEPCSAPGGPGGMTSAATPTRTSTSRWSPGSSSSPSV